MNEKSILILVLFGAILAYSAYRRGHSWWLWGLYGALLTPIAMVHALFIPDHRERDKAKKHKTKAKTPIPSVQHFQTVALAPDKSKILTLLARLIQAHNGKPVMRVIDNEIINKFPHGHENGQTVTDKHLIMYLQAALEESSRAPLGQSNWLSKPNE